MTPLRLCVHHVGGRGGRGAFPLPDQLASDSLLVLYDADADCLPGMEGEATVALPVCIAGTEGGVAFHITHDPHASSILSLNPAFADAYFFKNQYDSILGTVFRTVRTVQLPTETLDGLVASDRHRVPAPDILSLDTQGTELDILQGARHLLADQVVCVVAECEFLQVYEHQPLFGDIAGFLAEQGFVFIRFDAHGDLSLFRQPVGLRGRGIVYSGDGIFLKNPRLLAERSDDPDAVIKLRKLAVAALVFDQLEFALECLALARSLGVPSTLEPPAYWRFLDRLEEEAGRMAKVFPPTYDSVYPLPTATEAVTEAAKASGNTPCAPAGWRDRLKALLARAPHLYRAAVSVLQTIRLARMRVGIAWERVAGRPTRVETVLADHGFADLSRIVRDLRIRQAPWCRS